MKMLQALLEKAEEGHNQNMTAINARYTEWRRNWSRLVIAQQERAEGVPRNGTAKERAAQERQWLEDAATIRQAAEADEIAEQKRYSEEVQTLIRTIDRHKKEVCEAKLKEAYDYSARVDALRNKAALIANAINHRVAKVEKEHAETEILSECVARGEPVQAWQKPKQKTAPEAQPAVTANQLNAWQPWRPGEGWQPGITRKQANARAAEITAEMRDYEQQQREEIEVWNKYGLTLEDYRLVANE